LIWPVCLSRPTGLHRIGDAGAIDADPLLPVRLARLGEAGVDRFVRGDVDLREDAADF
jgi:hypothetical protein